MVHKVQRRTLRAWSIDAHYCAKLHKTVKQYAVLVKQLLEDAGYHDLMVAYVSADDKAKVSIGEPGLPIQLSARGKSSIIPVDDSNNLYNNSGDHNYSGQSATPSVNLISNIKVPDDRMIDIAAPAAYRGDPPSICTQIHTYYIHT